MGYVRRTYESSRAGLPGGARPVVARIENAELTVENQDLWNFVNRLKGSRVRQTFRDARSSDPAFHKRIERRLEKVGGLKYKFGIANEHRPGTNVTASTLWLA